MSYVFPDCSLVVSTYNWPEALELLLLSVQNQSQFPNEVIIADDGSKENTLDLIQRFQESFPIPIIHIWHRDKGNRKSIILNKAIARAKHSYIIEVDGDIIMHPEFIKDHLLKSEKGAFLYGSRVNIKEEHLEYLFKAKQIQFHYFSKGIKKRGRTLHIPFLANLYRPKSKRSLKFRGCNTSFWRGDFIKINGFNESITGWGMEDSEMIQRMINKGIKGKRLKFRGIVYHIYHKEQSKNRLAINKEIQKTTINEKLVYTKKGINQHL